MNNFKTTIIFSMSLIIMGCSYTPPPAPVGPVIAKQNGKPYWVDQGSCPKYTISDDGKDEVMCADADSQFTGVRIKPMSDEAYDRYLKFKLVQAQISEAEAKEKAAKSADIANGMAAFGNSMKQFSDTMNQNTQNTYQMINQMNNYNMMNRQTNCTTSYFGNQAYTNCR